MQLRIYRKIKGDLLKSYALRLIRAVQVFHDRGVLQWIS